MEQNRTAEKLLVYELATQGFHYHDIRQIHEEKVIPSKMIELIIKWLPAIYKEHLGKGEHLIRALISAESPFNPSIIIDLFENSNYNQSIKWTMAYVLAVSKTDNIDAYIKDQLFDKESTFERSAFLLPLTERSKLQIVRN